MTTRKHYREDFPYRQLGRRIKELRQRFIPKKTQRDVDREIGKAESYIGAVEIGRMRPEPPVLKKIADSLNADFNELAMLAGYIEQGHSGEVAVVIDDTRKAAVFRQMAAQFPAEVVEAAYDMAARLWLAVNDAKTHTQNEHQQAEDNVAH